MKHTMEWKPNIGLITEYGINFEKSLMNCSVTEKHSRHDRLFKFQPMFQIDCKRVLESGISQLLQHLVRSNWIFGTSISSSWIATQSVPGTRSYRVLERAIWIADRAYPSDFCDYGINPRQEFNRNSLTLGERLKISYMERDKDRGWTILREKSITLRFIHNSLFIDAYRILKWFKLLRLIFI